MNYRKWFILQKNAKFYNFNAYFMNFDFKAIKKKARFYVNRTF